MITHDELCAAIITLPAVTQTARFMPLQWQHCHNLWVTATTTNLATVHVRVMQLAFLFSSPYCSLVETTLAYSLICNMPRFVELRDHLSGIQQGRGLHLVPRTRWCFIFNGTQFPRCIFGAGLLFVQPTLSEMLDAGTIQSSRFLLCHVVWYCFLTCLDVTERISRICENSFLVQLELHLLGWEAQLQPCSRRKRSAFNSVNFVCLTLWCWWHFFTQVLTCDFFKQVWRNFRDCIERLIVSIGHYRYKIFGLIISGFCHS